MVTHRELTIEDYLQILRRRWMLIVIFLIVGGAMGIGVTRILPKRFTSQTLVLVEQPNISGELVPQVVSNDTNERLASMQQQILSRSRLEPVINELHLYRQDLNRVPMEELVARLRKIISISGVAPMAQTSARGLPGFTIKVDFESAAIAQQICSTVTSMFLEENGKLQQKKAEQTTDFLESQLQEAKTKLDEQDAKLAAFQRGHIGSLPDDQNTNLNVLNGLTTQLDAATQALGRAQQDKTYAESQLAQQRSAWLATLEGTNPETHAQQLANLEAQLSALKAKYTDSHPDVVRLKGDIAALRKTLESTETDTTVKTPVKTPPEPAQIQGLRAQIHQFELTIQERSKQQEEIQARIRSYQNRIESTPAVEQEYKSLTRDYQTALELYNDLLKKRGQAQMATALQREQQGEQFRILDPASLPDKPSFPDPVKFGLGGFGGGMALGVGLSLLLEMRDTSLRSDKDLEALIHLPVLAVLPSLEDVSKGKLSIPFRGLAKT